MWRSPIHASSTLEEKMIGVHLALLLPQFKNLKEMHIEGDNQSVMLALHQKSFCLDWRLNPMFVVILDSV